MKPNIRTCSFTPPLMARELSEILARFPPQTRIRGVDIIEARHDGIHFVHGVNTPAPTPVPSKPPKRRKAKVEGAPA